MPDGENYKTLIVSPGQTLLFISKQEISDADLQHFVEILSANIAPGVKFVVVDGTQFEVAVVDDRKIEGYVPEDMDYDP